MGGGSGYAHRVQLPEGSMMAEVFVADILASMEGLTLDASVQAHDTEEHRAAPPPPPKRAAPHPAPAKPAARRFLEVEGEQPPLQKARGATAMQPEQAEGPPPGSAAASSAPSASARPPSASARPADVTPPWHRQDANPSAAAREPSATAEECADRWHEEVVKRSNWLTLQDALAPQFRMFDPVMFLAWKTS